MPSSIAFTLPFHGHPRRVRTYVPDGIEATPPVLVMFDGQNVLDDAGSFVGGWHAHTAVARLPSTVRKPVLVAIDHGGAARIRELWADLDATLRFVITLALPAAEHRLARHFDPSLRVIGGSSMGGLASLAAIARHPDVFRGAIAMSPSAWTVPRAIARELSRARFAVGTRIYVDVGLRESEGMVREATRAASIVATRLDVDHRMWRPDRRGKHRESDWKRRLPKALRFAFHGHSPR